MQQLNSEFIGRVLLAALGSGSIKLQGLQQASSGDAETAAKYARADAAYVQAFMDALSQQPNPPA